MEYRAFRADGVAADDEGIISGLIAPYNSRTRIGGKAWGFDEEISPGTFTKSVSEGDVVALDNHDPHRPLARQSSGTLSFDDKSNGLYGEAQTNDTSYAQDLRKNVKSKNYGGWSFGFEVVKDEWRDKDGKPSNRFEGTHRILREVKLIEVSPVTFPAYKNTKIAARGAETNELLEEREAYWDGQGPEHRGPKPYGDVKYADQKNGKYPIDTLKHVKAAWAYINQAKNAAKYPLNGVSLSSVKAAIKAALKKFGVKISSENEEQLATEWREELLTGLYCTRCGEVDDDVADEPEEGDGREQEPESSTPDPEGEELSLDPELELLKIQHARRAEAFA